MNTADAAIDRINAYLAHAGISQRAVARATGLHGNTVRSALKHRICRLETIRRIEALVPQSFQIPSGLPGVALTGASNCTWEAD